MSYLSPVRPVYAGSAAPIAPGGPAPVSQTLFPATLRDSAMAALPDAAAAVNGLAAASGSNGSGSSAMPQLSLPPLPPMPAPKPAGAVPTDDHGKSNVVFADDDADGALIH